MPMSDADKVALRTFISTRRGEKVLQPDIQREMLNYLVAKTHPGHGARMYGRIQ